MTRNPWRISRWAQLRLWLGGRRRDVWAADPSTLDTYTGGPRHRAWARAGLCPTCGHTQHSPDGCLACYCRTGAA